MELAKTMKWIWFYTHLVQVEWQEDCLKSYTRRDEMYCCNQLLAFWSRSVFCALFFRFVALQEQSVFDTMDVLHLVNDPYVINYPKEFELKTRALYYGSRRRDLLPVKRCLSSGTSLRWEVSKCALISLATIGVRNGLPIIQRQLAHLFYTSNLMSSHGWWCSYHSMNT